MFFNKLNPFSPKKSATEKSNTWKMWFKVVVACIPAGVIGLLLNDFMERFENWMVVSAMLILYGIAFIIIEKIILRNTIWIRQECIPRLCLRLLSTVIL